jgi:hypothetical protein
LSGPTEAELPPYFPSQDAELVIVEPVTADEGDDLANQLFHADRLSILIGGPSG